MNNMQLTNLYNIDSNKLDRDYINNPLKKGKGSPKPKKAELPTKHDLYYLYIEKNMTRSDILKYFNCSCSVFKRWCKKYNIKKPLILLEKNAKKSIYKKYGVYNYSQTKEYKKYMKENKEKINNKTYEGMKKSGNFGKSISLEEKKIFNLLKTKYQNIKIQYKSKEYPFKCDFYIPEKDLYIEYQGYWKHGPIYFYLNNKLYNCHCIYNKNNFIHTEVVKYWKSKNSKFYDDAIDVWTKKDPLKRETAIKNNLNYLEFFTMDEFLTWFNN